MSSKKSLEQGLQHLDDGEYAAARVAFRAARDNSNKGSKDYAGALLWLGSSEIKLDLSENARQNLEEAEKEYEKLGKSDNSTEELAQVRTRLGDALTNLDQFSAAEQKLEQALDTGREACGPYSVQVADTIAMQGLNDVRSNRLDQGEARLSKSFGMRRGLLGGKHSELAQSMNQLSFCYSQQGKFAPAEVLARQALEMQEAIIGSGHPEYGVTLLNLSTVYIKQGRLSRAEPCAEECVDVLKSSLPPAHAWNIYALDRLGTVMLSTGKNKEARDTYSEALDLAQRRWGKESPYTVGSLIGLGLANLNCQDFRTSEKYLSIALDLMKGSGTLDTKMEYSLLQQLACSYVFQLKISDAVRLVPDSLRARHTANFNETIDMVNTALDFVGGQIENLKN